MEKIVLYLAGGLFNASERLHNLYLEKYLKELGYEIILPQREAKRFFGNGLFSIQDVVEDCHANVVNKTLLLVGNIDGPDADSGTAFEVGSAVTATLRAMVYRTDFRTDPVKEIGYNAMFRKKGIPKLIYEPCLFTELDEVEPFYRKLAERIHQLVQQVLGGTYVHQDMTPQQSA